VLGAAVENHQVFFLVAIKVNKEKLHGVKSSSPGVFQTSDGGIRDLLKRDLLRVREESGKTKGYEKDENSHSHKGKSEIEKNMLIYTD
jgi:hypothetical protein